MQKSFFNVEKLKKYRRCPALILMLTYPINAEKDGKKNLQYNFNRLSWLIF